MDFDYAHYMLTEGAKGKENPVACSPSREAYMKQLTESLNMNRTRILAFKNKPPTPVDLIPHNISSSTHQQDKTVKPRRVIPQVSLGGQEIIKGCSLAALRVLLATNMEIVQKYDLNILKSLGVEAPHGVANDIAVFRTLIVLCSRAVHLRAQSWHGRRHDYHCGNCYDVDC